MPSMALLCVYLHSNGPKEVFTHYSVCVCVCVCLCVCVGGGGSLGPYLFPSAQAKVSVITVTAREGGRETSCGGAINGRSCGCLSSLSFESLVADARARKRAKYHDLVKAGREGGRERGRYLPDIVWWSNQRKELWLFELTELRVTGSRCQSQEEGQVP